MNIRHHGVGSSIVRRSTLLAAAAAAAIVSTSVQAAVVDSGPVSIAIPDTVDGVYLNVLTGQSGATSAAVPGYDVNPYSAAAGQFNLWGPTTNTWFNPQGVTAGNYNLPPGTAIQGATTAFFRPGASVNVGTQVTLNSSNNFVGFRFVNESGGTTHFGYLQVQFGATAGTRTIVRYFYESTPDTAISIPGGAVPPTFAYTPATGSTVGFTGSTTLGGTANGSIAVALGTPAGSGTGAAATTTLTCTAPTAPFSGFGQTITAIGNGAISGTSLSGTCTVGATAVTQTLTCNENRGGTANARTWTLSCPAAVVPVTSVPASGSTITLSRTLGGAAATSNIVFSNPGTAASALACTFSGAGAASFSTTNPNPSVPAGGSATVPVSYNSATVGSASATLTCTGAQTFTFTLNGTTAAPAPTAVPVFHGKGLWLALMLVFGFGLAALVTRRG